MIAPEQEYPFGVLDFQTEQQSHRFHRIISSIDKIANHNEFIFGNASALFEHFLHIIKLPVHIACNLDGASTTTMLDSSMGTFLTMLHRARTDDYVMGLQSQHDYSHLSRSVISVSLLFEYKYKYIYKLPILTSIEIVNIMKK